MGGPACRMLPPAKQDAACGVTVTTESVKCGLTKLTGRRGFEGLRASQLHVQPRTQQNRTIVLRGGGGDSRLL